MGEKSVENADGSQGRIFSLTIDEVNKFCRLGQGADTCIWLVVGKGFECLYFNRRAVSLTGEILEERWKAGKTVAKRDGCDEVRALAIVLDAMKHRKSFTEHLKSDPDYYRFKHLF